MKDRRIWVSKKISNNKYLLGCAFLHLINDGFFVLLYPLLPLIAEEFDLSFSRVGILRTAFSFSASVLQLPFSFLSEKLWEMMLLVGGIGWLSGGIVVMGLSGTFLSLIIFSVISGLGGNIQHPVGSAFISRIYENRKRGSAIGVLNFSGDIGKIIYPLLVSAILLSFHWRQCLIIIGASGLIIAALMGSMYRKSKETYQYKRKNSPEKFNGAWGVSSPVKFGVVSLIGIIDAIVRTALLTFIPFLFINKGLPSEQNGFLLTLLFIGGAGGKLGCGFMSDRFGMLKMIIITEVLTAVSIFMLPFISPAYIFFLLVGCGFVLNGTSTVLYTTIAELVSPHGRSRGYGLFYTVYLSSEAIGPVVFGFIGDTLGLNWIFFMLAFISIWIVPLAFALKSR